MSKWQANVISMDNGFIVEYTEEGKKKKIVLYEEREDTTLVNPSENNKEHIVDMFYDLLEFFGQQSNKHDKKRINITYEQ